MDAHNEIGRYPFYHSVEDLEIAVISIIFLESTIENLKELGKTCDFNKTEGFDRSFKFLYSLYKRFCEMDNTPAKTLMEIIEFYGFKDDPNNPNRMIF